MIATGNGGDERHYDRNSQRLAKRLYPEKYINTCIIQKRFNIHPV